MAKKKANRASGPELKTRHRLVMEWILEDHTYTDIIKSILGKWDVSERQAARYYADAYKLLSDSEPDTNKIEYKKNYYLQRKKKLIRDMNPAEKKTAAGAAAINRILDSMAEIEGIKVNKHELTGKDGAPIKTDFTITMIESGPKPASSEKDLDIDE